MTEPFLADYRVQRAIELVWREAALLDSKDYETWEKLYTDDGLYVVPIDPAVTDFLTSLNMIHDDQRMRHLRVERMVQGFSPSAVAAARTVRVVSRFTVESVSDDLVVIHSAQILSAFKRQSFTTMGAELTHEIALSPDGEQIKLKVARLNDSEDAVSASGFLV